MPSASIVSGVFIRILPWWNRCYITLFSTLFTLARANSFLRLLGWRSIFCDDLSRAVLLMVLTFLVALTGLVICAIFFIPSALAFLCVFQIMLLWSCLQITVFFFINNIFVLGVSHDCLAIFEGVFRIRRRRQIVWLFLILLQALLQFYILLNTRGSVSNRPPVAVSCRFLISLFTLDFRATLRQYSGRILLKFLLRWRLVLLLIGRHRLHSLVLLVVFKLARAHNFGYASCG